MKYPKTIGIMADLHCASKEGLLSPRNEEHRQNPGQKYLYRCYMWLAENWPKLDLLVINGDVIDGEQYKSRGTGILTTKLDEQVDIAIEVVEDWCDINHPKKIVRMEGTPYHESFHGALSAFDRALGAKRRGMKGLYLNLAGGKVAHFAHHPDGGNAIYKGTTVERGALWKVVREHRQRVPRADICVQSHVHMYYRQDSFGKVMILTPCFQLQTAYAAKAHLDRWQPDIGGILLTYDPVRKDYTVDKFVFDLPEVKAEDYDRL